MKAMPVLVTGAGRGIGKRLAMGFAARGARVVLAARSKSALEKAEKEISGSFAVPTDMTKPEDIASLIAKSQEAYGEEIHMLINVAGGLVARKTTQEMDGDFWDKIFDLNVKSVFMASKAA